MIKRSLEQAAIVGRPSLWELQIAQDQIQAAAQGALSGSHAVQAMSDAARTMGVMEEALLRSAVASMPSALTDANLAARLMQYHDVLLDAVVGIDLEGIRSSQVMAAIERERQDELAEAMNSAGLIAAPSLGRELEDRILDAHEDDVDSDTIWGMVEDHYDADDAARIETIVNRLKFSKDFGRRPRALDDVLTAHRGKLDTLTTQPLVSLIEGVLVPLLEEEILPIYGQNARIKHNTIVETIVSTPFVLYGPRTAQLVTVLHYMHEHLYASFDFRTDPQRRSDATHLNRHQLDHGHVAGNRRNTLRCFLILDVLVDIVLGLRESAGAL